MKYCPKCNTKYGFDMSFCLEDGTPLQLSGNQTQTEYDSQDPIPVPQPKLTQPNFESENVNGGNIGEQTLALPQTSLPQTNISPPGNIGEQTLALPSTDSAMQTDAYSADMTENNLALPLPPIPEPPFRPQETQGDQPNDWNNKQTNPHQDQQSLPNQPVLTSKYEAAPRKSNPGLLVAVAAAGLLLIGTVIGGILYLNWPPTETASSNNGPNNSSNRHLSPANSSNNNAPNSNTNDIPSQLPGDNTANSANQPVSNSTENPVSNSTDKSTPKPTASAENTPKPSPEITPVIDKTPPTPTPTPKTPTPTPTRTPMPDGPRTVSGGVLNGRAIALRSPTYPPAAKAVQASGRVVVQVTIDENGNVVSASAVSGHPLLKSSSEQAARGSRFSPMLINGERVRVTGTIVYNYTAQ